MSAALLERAGVVAWSPRATEEQGLITSSGNDLSYHTVRDIGCQQRAGTIVQSAHSYSSLLWTGNILVGGSQNGSVVFLDTNSLVKGTQCQYFLQRRDHTHDVTSIGASVDGRWVATAGGQILLWDVTNLVTPYSPGSWNEETRLIDWCPKEPTVFATASSGKAVVWDMRQHGKPTIHLTQSGIDYSSLAWSPRSQHHILIADRSPHHSVVEEWDVRYVNCTAGPVAAYGAHRNGTIAARNVYDSRLIVTADRYGASCLFHDSLRCIVGKSPCIQDEIVRITWSPHDYGCFAIQYAQNPVQVVWLNGKNTATTANMNPTLSEEFIPSWLSPKPIGCSLALGHKLVTNWRSYDHYERSTVSAVEVEHVTRTNPKEMDNLQNFMQITKPARFGQFFADKAAPEPDEMKSLAWQFLSVIAGGGKIDHLVDDLGFVPDRQTSLKRNEATTSTTTISSVSTSVTTSSSASFTLNSIDWNTIDDEGWSLLDHWLSQNHDKVVQILLSRKLYLAACVYASQHGSCGRVIDRYLQEEEQTANESLAFLLSFGLPEDTSNLHTFPVTTHWRRFLATVITGSTTEERMEEAAKKAGKELMEQGNTAAALLAFILTKDLQLVLSANSHFDLGERVMQGISLLHFNDGVMGETLEDLIHDYVDSLTKRGMYETAWELCKGLKFKTMKMIEMLHTLYYVAGGRDCTLDPPPLNPYVKEAADSINKHPSNGSVHTFMGPPPSASPASSIRDPQQQRKLAPMPPSSMFYQTQSWDHTPKAPLMPLPPQKPMTPGWNDPPPLPARQSVAAPVMQINWNPAMNVMQQPQMVPMVPNVVPAISIHQQQDRLPDQPLVFNLGQEEESIMSHLKALIDSIKSYTPGDATKVENVRAKIWLELPPRLATQKLSPHVIHAIQRFIEALSRRDFPTANGIIASLARSVSDFVEVSSFLPSLKSLRILIEKSY